MPGSSAVGMIFSLQEQFATSNRDDFFVQSSGQVRGASNNVKKRTQHFTFLDALSVT